MNEQIKELIEKSYDYEPHERDWDVTVKTFNKKRFAELIIQECLQKCQQVVEDADFMTKSEFVTASGKLLHEGMWGGATNCVNEIKQHFGVE